MKLFDLTDVLIGGGWLVVVAGSALLAVFDLFALLIPLGVGMMGTGMLRAR